MHRENGIHLEPNVDITRVAMAIIGCNMLAFDQVVLSWRSWTSVLLQSQLNRRLLSCWKCYRLIPLLDTAIICILLRMQQRQMTKTLQTFDRLVRDKTRLDFKKP